MLSRGVSLAKLDTLKIFHSPSIPVELDTLDLVLPSLRSLNTSITVDSFRTKWDALTSFTGQFLGPASFHRFIHDASNLEFLEIICIGDVEDVRTVDPRRQAVDHGNLRRLVLDTRRALRPILDKVSFPALHELVLERTSHGHSYLEVPEDRDPGIQLSNFRSILGMSTIVSLTVNPGESLSNIAACLQSLEITSSAPSLPGLCQLELMHDMGDSHLFITESLQSMIMSRWNTSDNTARLAKFTLADAYPERGYPDVEAVEKYTTSTLALFLLELQEAGLEVSWELGEIDVMKDAYDFISETPFDMSRAMVPARIPVARACQLPSSDSLRGTEIHHHKFLVAWQFLDDGLSHEVSGVMRTALVEKIRPNMPRLAAKNVCSFPIRESCSFLPRKFLFYHHQDSVLSLRIVLLRDDYPSIVTIWANVQDRTVTFAYGGSESGLFRDDVEHLQISYHVINKAGCASSVDTLRDCPRSAPHVFCAVVEAHILGPVDGDLLSRIILIKLVQSRQFGKGITGSLHSSLGVDRKSSALTPSTPGQSIFRRFSIAELVFTSDGQAQLHVSNIVVLRHQVFLVGTRQRNSLTILRPSLLRGHRVVRETRTTSVLLVDGDRVHLLDRSSLLCPTVAGKHTVSGDKAQRVGELTIRVSTVFTSKGQAGNGEVKILSEFSRWVERTGQNDNQACPDAKPEGLQGRSHISTRSQRRTGAPRTVTPNSSDDGEWPVSRESW
ncbi:hypothetical protein BDZ89DRAFT_1051892 [Hymenopellis radicata]|nr:hypothetical protein BDZ89DRAFT_1051892 [Hymenopellis radicata]